MAVLGESACVKFADSVTRSSDQGDRAVRVVAIESDVVMIKVAGQLAVRVGQFEEQFGPVFEGGDRVGTGGEAQRRLVAAARWTRASASLAGSPPAPYRRRFSALRLSNSS